MYQTKKIASVSHSISKILDMALRKSFEKSYIIKELLKCKLKYTATIAVNCHYSDRSFLHRPKYYGSKQFHSFHDKSDVSNCHLLEETICA